ncbi:MAG TPA: formate dehydrogenase subunit delta [Kofleriaceae bacterium]|jgi:formate dehydrogenase subunit delta|nr:formate dehydrogenase subunit delta [Kofleriaceae bacterium]
MDPHKLVKMANQIASFFESEPDRAVMLESVAGHLKRFWDPRMRRELLRWQDEHHGEGLKDAVRDAIAAHRDRIASGL